MLKYKRKSDFGNISLNEVLHIIFPNKDGIQIGKGEKAFWVKYPKFEDIDKGLL